MRMDEMQLRKEIKEVYGLSDEEIDEELKSYVIRNTYSALIQLKNKLSNDKLFNINKETINSLNRQANLGKRLIKEGFTVLSAIETSKGKTLEINNNNINKILELTANSEKMIRTGLEMESRALEKILKCYEI